MRSWYSGIRKMQGIQDAHTAKEQIWELLSRLTGSKWWLIVNQHVLRIQRALHTGSMRSSSMSDPSSSRNAAWEPITNSVAPDRKRDKWKKSGTWREKHLEFVQHAFSWHYYAKTFIEYNSRICVHTLIFFKKQLPWQAQNNNGCQEQLKCFGLPRTQKTAAPAPANQNTGRDTAPAKLIWWGTVSSLPGWQERKIKNKNTDLTHTFVLPLGVLVEWQ